jgi:hypothetical protein
VSSSSIIPPRDHARRWIIGAEVGREGRMTGADGGPRRRAMRAARHDDVGMAQSEQDGPGSAGAPLRQGRDRNLGAERPAVPDERPAVPADPLVPDDPAVPRAPAGPQDPPVDPAEPMNPA